jgi:thiamine pyrophosphokinase
VVDAGGKYDTVVVVAGGPGSRLPTLEVPVEAPVVAADGGVDRALALGLQVEVAVGDFDSVTPPGLAAVRAAGARIERYPPDKDATDLELALDAAIALSPRRILVLGSDSGRLDHLLSMLLLLGVARLAPYELDASLGPATVHVIRSERRLAGDRGELISLFALHGPVDGVTTDGLLFPLRGETLEPGSSRGVSNVFAAPEAHIRLERGVLLAVRPGNQTVKDEWGTP